MGEPRSLRADAVRNRARLLQVAYETFASDGLAVPIDEIARRAGVGPGTVYRHFPTKDALFAAIVADRLAHHTAYAGQMAERTEPGPAFFAFLDWVVREGGVDQGLMEALAGTGFDLATAVPEAEQEWLRAFERLLTAAQASGDVRSDLGVADLKSLVVGYQALLRHRADPAAADRLITMLNAGLVPPVRDDHA
ncbi:TetR/AcrR family transcriptional regulator [uncultured Friedmanniella sp.]|uniref:TetR/AcrR family transcriptional regulator n=1 Tax=uncultured Friedmanniella sp. TaxID=335381 RepID=UPI0035CB60DC